jgi:pimeloyl-ACP methyl ester carboxylesterase
MTVRATTVGRETRGPAAVDDLAIEAGVDPPLQAFLVAPERATGPAVLAWHWFDTAADDSDRTQFLDEAVELAGLGITSLLPQGRFPWATAPTGATADRAAIEAEVERLHAGVGLLGAIPGVDRTRIALVGHDFGGMLAAVAAPDVVDLRALVVVAATPRWGDWFLPFWPIPDDRMDYLRALRPLDPIERLGALADVPVLFQFGRRDFFIAPMTGLEFRGGAPASAELLPYDDEHAMRDPAIRADRIAFLRRTLGLA